MKRKRTVKHVLVWIVIFCFLCETVSAGSNLIVRAADDLQTEIINGEAFYYSEDNIIDLDSEGGNAQEVGEMLPALGGTLEFTDGCISNFSKEHILTEDDLQNDRESLQGQEDLEEIVTLPDLGDFGNEGTSSQEISGSIDIVSGDEDETSGKMTAVLDGEEGVDTKDVLQEEPLHADSTLPEDALPSLGASSPWIKSLPDSITVTKGSRRALVITWGANCDWNLGGDTSDNLGASWENVNVRLCSAKLWVSGLEKGMGLVTLRLTNKANNKVLAMKYIWVNVVEPDPTLSFSSDNVSVLNGNTAIVWLHTQGLDSRYALEVDFNEQICQASFGSNNGVSYALRLQGKKAGSTSIKVSIKRRSNGKVITSGRIAMTVRPLPVMRPSVSKMTVNQYETKTFRLNIDNLNGVYEVDISGHDIYYGYSDLRDWNGKYGYIDVTGRKAGAWTLTITIREKNSSKVLATCSVRITVQGAIPKLTSSLGSLSMKTGEDRSVNLSISGTKEDVSVGAVVSGGCCSTQWGKAGDGSIPLNIHAIKSGSAYITVKLYRTADMQYLSGTTIYVNVSGAVTFTAGTGSLTLDAGQSKEVQLTAGGTSAPISMSYSVSGSSISCNWTGRWNGQATWLNITGKTAGTSVVTVYLYDSSVKELLKTVQITVKVMQKKSSVKLSLTPLSLDAFEEFSASIIIENAPVDGSVIVMGNHEDIVGYTTGEYNNGRIPLILSGLSSGTSTTYIKVLDAGGATAASCSFTTKVSGNGVNDASYKFGNSGADFKYPSEYRIPLSAYQRIYGDTQSARNLYAAGGEWGGNCYGMVSTAAFFLRSYVMPYTFRIGAFKPKALEIFDRHSGWGITLTEFIEAMQVSWGADYTTRKYESRWNDLDGLYNVVEDGVSSGIQGVIIAICGQTQDENGKYCDSAHAVLGLAARKINSSTGRLYIYDPNFPGTIRYITVGFRGGKAVSWSYPLDNTYWWGSDRPNGNIAWLLDEECWEIWKNRGNVEPYIETNMLIANEDNFEIYDTEDKLVASMVDGRLQTAGDRTDIFQVCKLDDMWPGRQIVYLPRDEAYTLKKTGDNADMFEVSMTNRELGVSVRTSMKEFDLAVSDRENIQSCYLTADAGAFYEIQLQSSRESDPDIRVMSGIGNGQKVGMGRRDGELNSMGAEAVTDISGTVTLEASAWGGGTITPSGEREVKYGTSHFYEIKPNEGYQIKDVQIDGRSVGAVTSYTLENISADHKITALFEKINASGNGTTETEHNSDKGNSTAKPFINVNETNIVLGKKQTTSGLKVGMADGDKIVFVKSNKSGIVKVGIKDAVKGVLNLKAGKKTGKAKVTIVLQSGLKKTIAVKVQTGKVKTKSIVLKKTNLTLRPGEKFSVKPALRPFTSQEKIYYKISDKKTATVTKSGVVKARGKGTAKITIRSGKKKKIVKIKVK